MSSHVIFFQINLNLQSHYIIITVLTVTSIEFTDPVLPKHGVTVLGLAKLVLSFFVRPKELVKTCLQKSDNSGVTG